MPERARPLREPAIWILLVTVVVHVIRRNVLDVTVFLGTAALILLDSRAVAKRAAWRVRASWRTVLAVSVVYAVAVFPLSRTGYPMRAAVAVPGILALAAVWRTLGRRAVPVPAGRQPRAWLVWPSLLVVGAVFELLNFAQQPDVETDSWAHPTVSAVVDPLLAGHGTRAVAAGLWVAAGFWLVAQMLRSLDPASPRGGAPVPAPGKRPHVAGEELS